MDSPSARLPPVGGQNSRTTDHNLTVLKGAPWDHVQTWRMGALPQVTPKFFLDPALSRGPALGAPWPLWFVKRRYVGHTWRKKKKDQVLPADSVFSHLQPTLHTTPRKRLSDMTVLWDKLNFTPSTQSHQLGIPQTHKPQNLQT